ncbi:unnamed protein product, partial [Rotaria sp. Silwood1]
MNTTPSPMVRADQSGYPT